MTEKEKKEYADSLKDGIKEFLDCIDTDNDFGRHVIKLIYGFARSGFMEYGVGKKKGGVKA